MRDGDDWQQQQDEDYQVAHYMAAVETVAAFVGGDEGERVRRSLLEIAHLPMPAPAQQMRLPDMSVDIPY